MDFISTGEENLSSSELDQRRVAVYDLYEDIYRNATATLRIVLRGDDQAPILVPNGRKIVEATSRFLAKNVDYFVDVGGDEGTRQEVDLWWASFYKREAFVTKFNSNKRWGLVRGDSYWYLYADPNKEQGDRISIKELDPRQVFEIEDNEGDLVGVHIVDLIHDFREPDKPDKKIVRRRTFRQQPVGADNKEDGKVIGISSELTFWEVGKWDDRTPKAVSNQKRVSYPDQEQEEFMLPAPITQLPVYKWRNSPAQNSTWGTSQLAGLETLLYALNQSLSDEDATIVFQGLGMYVTNAAPPIDPNTGDVTDWNIGPKQIIEISGDQKFDRVTGVSDVSPFTDHMNYIDDKMMEASGTPTTAIGRVDVSVAASGIALQLELMPLIAANAEKELELINILDQLYHDITTMWLPAYEPEKFGNAEVMSQISVVCLFDDPMPVDKAAETQEVIALDQANLILKSMAVAKLRQLGWKFPTVDANGQPLTDDDLAAMLLSQAQQYAAAADPYAGLAGGSFDAQGNPIPPDQNQVDGNGQGNTPDQQTISLGTS